jgi:hypothetical protein
MIPLALLAALAAAPPALTVPLRIRVADCGGPTRPAGWVTEQVEAARAVLAPHGIALTVDQVSFAPPICEVLTEADRDRFAAAVPDERVVTVLVLPRVRDLAVTTYDLMGVHWRGGGRRWIFLTARARPPVLAHELCHFFGLPHDPAGGNLMAPGPSSPRRPSTRPFAPVLTPVQARRVRAGISAWRAGR